MKQYFTGFFTAVCLTASVFIFMGSQNKNLGDIVVHSISVQNDGKEVVWLGTGEGGVGFLETFDADGKKTVYLGTGEEGVGFLKTHNIHEKMTGYFGTDKNNDGVIGLFDRYGDEGWFQSGKQ